jgi:hypothetical protein
VTLTLARKGTGRVFTVQLVRHGRNEYTGAGAPVPVEDAAGSSLAAREPPDGVVMSKAPDVSTAAPVPASQDFGRGGTQRVLLLNGYDPNTWDPPLRYGDTVALIVEGQNALVAYAGALDGRPWVEVLAGDVSVPPNAEACQWRLEPAMRCDASKKLKAFLKSQVWDKQEDGTRKNLPVPDIPGKHAHLDKTAAEFVASNGLSPDSYDLVLQLFERLCEVGVEREENQAERKRKQGEHLTYGSALILVHVLTGTVLTLTKTRGLQDITKRLRFDELGTNRSNLVVRPAHKTHGEGSSVAAGDLVQFVTKGTISGVHLRLHVSDDPRFGGDPYIVRQHLMINHPCITGVQELNALKDEKDEMPKLFRILTFRTLENEFKNLDKLKGGNVFMFYHKQAGGYLHYDPEVSERPFFYKSSRVSARQRKKSQWMWRIESCQLYNGGDEVLCNEGAHARYRIRHVLTDMFIVHKRGGIFVTSNLNDPDTVFGFKHFAKDDHTDGIRVGEMIFIKTHEGDFLTEADPAYTKSVIEHAPMDIGETKDLKKRILHIRVRRLERLPEADAFVITPATPKTITEVLELKRLLHCLEDLAEQLSRMEDCASGGVSLQQQTRDASCVVLARTDSAALLNLKTAPSGQGEDRVLEIVANCTPNVESVLVKLLLNLSHGDEPSPFLRDGEPNKLLQKLLRELKIFPLAIRLLQLPFQKGVDINKMSGQTFFTPLVTVLNLVHRLLKQLAKKNLVNSTILFSHLQVLRAQLGKGGLQVSPVIKEMFLDKPSLLNIMPADVITDFIELLCKQRAPQYIDFLMNVITWGPVSQLEPVVRVQMLVIEALQKNLHLLPSLKLHHKDISSQTASLNLQQHVSATVHVGDEILNLASFNGTRQKGGKEWDYVGWIMYAEIRELSDSEKALRYFVRCSNLYGRLTLGRNEQALRMLIFETSLALSYNEIMLVIQEESVPHMIRSRYMVLMARLYVDRDPQVSVPMVTSTRVWSKIHHLLKPMATFERDVPETSDLNMDVSYSPAAIPVCTNGFIDLQRFLVTSVPKLAGCKDKSGKLSLNGDQQWGRLELIRAQYILCETLLNFGYFHDDGAILQLFHGAFLALDSRESEEEHTLLGSRRLHSSVQLMQDAQLAVDKTGGVTCLGSRRLAAIAHTLREGISPKAKTQASDADDEQGQKELRKQVLLERSDQNPVATLRNEVREEALRILLRFLEYRVNKRITGCIDVWEDSVFETFRSTEKLRELVDPAFLSPTINGRIEQNDSAMAALTNIFSGAQHIVHGLEARLFTQPIISPAAVGSDVYRPGDLTDNTQQVLLDLCTFGYQPLTQAAMAVLIRNMSQRNALMHRLNDVQILVYPQAASIHQEAQIIIKRMSNLHKRIAAAEDETAYKDALAVLNRLSDMVSMRHDLKPEIVASNQSILLNLGADMTVRRMLGLYLECDTSRRSELELDRPRSMLRRDLFQECYMFLRAFARKNAKAQNALFLHIRTFAEHMGIENLNVADTLAEIVRDNAKLCAQVDKDVLEIFVTCIKTWGRRAGWLSFYQALMIIEGKEGKTPVRSAQDMIIKLLLEDKEAILDLTCDYRNTQFLPRADIRYGMTRIDLLLANDHKRPIFSLVKYHCATLKTLAGCAFGRHQKNQGQIRGLLSVQEVVDNILDIDLKENGERENRINRDAVRRVQASWMALLTDVYLTNGTQVFKDVAELSRVWGDDSSPSAISLFSLFGITFAIFQQRLCRLKAEDFVGRPELFDSLEDEYGYDMGAHLELAQETARACFVFCENWKSYVGTERPPTNEAQSVRDNAVHLYTASEQFGLMGLSSKLAKLITSMTKLGLVSDSVLQNNITLLQNKITRQDDRVNRGDLLPEQAFLEGWSKFKIYLSHTFGIDPRPDHSMNKAVQDIALMFGSTKTHMNEHLQSLEKFSQVLATKNCDEFLMVVGLKILRAIVYMRPVQEPASASKFDAEYQRHLDNLPASDLGTHEHENWQSRIAHHGGVLVACAGIKHASMDVVRGSLLLATTLLDGSNPYVNECFSKIMLPASSGPFFKKLKSFFEDAEHEIRRAKHRAKQAHVQRVALIKAGITPPPETGDIQGAENQAHMRDVLFMMQLMCDGDSKNDDIFRVQKFNLESFNFFSLTVSYVSEVEPEMKKALSRDHFELLEAMVCGLNFLCQGMRTSTGPHIENQSVIADSGIFDVCDCIFSTIRFERRRDTAEKMSQYEFTGVREAFSADHERLQKRNQMRNKLRLAAISILDVFLEGVEVFQSVNQMLVRVNWKSVVERMTECYDMYQSGDSRRGYDLPQEASLKEGLGHYFILKHMKHYDTKKAYIVPELETVPHKVLAFFEKHTGYVEIVRHKRLERVYFQKPENCLPRGPLDTPKVDVKMYDAERSDLEKKQQEFLHNLCELVEEEKFRSRIRKSPMSFTVTRVNLVRSINFLWILVMHLAMLNLSYMPKRGFWLQSFQEDFQARLDVQWYGIKPDDDYGYDDGDDLRILSRRLPGARRFKHGRRHGGHSATPHSHAHLVEKLHTRRADVGSGSPGNESSGSPGKESAGESAGYECAYDGPFGGCAYSNGEGGGYGRVQGWEYAWNLTTSDVHFFQDVLPVLTEVVRYMSWINLITCGFRFFAFVWAEVPMMIWRKLDEEVAEELDESEQADPEEQDSPEQVMMEDTIWIDNQKRTKDKNLPWEEDKEAEVHIEGDKRGAKIRIFLSSTHVWYETAFVVFPLIAVITDEPLFSAYSLLEMCWWESSRPVTDAGNESMYVIAENAG